MVADLHPDLPTRRGGVVLDGRPVALAGGLCLNPVGQRRRRPVGADRDDPHLVRALCHASAHICRDSRLPLGRGGVPGSHAHRRVPLKLLGRIHAEGGHLLGHELPGG